LWPSAIKDGDGRLGTKETFGKGSSTGLAFRNGYLYVATTVTVERYKMTPGTLLPTGPMETIVTGLPKEREHEDKSIAFDGEGSLYINVGAPSNTARRVTARPNCRDRIPARFSKSMAESGSSTRTN